MNCYRRLPVLESTAGEISSSTGNPVLAVSLDVRNPDTVKEAFDTCEAKFGLPDIVINNAAGNFISVLLFAINIILERLFKL